MRTPYSTTAYGTERTQPVGTSYNLVEHRVNRDPRLEAYNNSTDTLVLFSTQALTVRPHSE